MENRRSARIIPGYKAEIIYSGHSYSGVIDDLCEYGLCVITSPLANEVDFVQNDKIDVRFTTHTDETLTLNCLIKWTSKTHPERAVYKIGMQIIAPPWEDSESFL